MSAALPPRAALAEAGVRVLSRGGARNADVLLVPTADGPIVVKDYSPRGPLVRSGIGPWLAAREQRALARLQGLESVPRLLGRVDALAFALQYRPGERMSRSLAGRIPPDFMHALQAAVQSMHRRGVVHLDLKHRSNVLIDEKGRPVLLDFASAVCFREGSWLYRWYRPTLARYDLDALEKWRVRLVPAGGA